MNKIAISSLILFGSSLLAHPIGGEIISGSVDFSSSVITASDKAIIHWQEFSNSPGETTHLILPNSESALLNRVVGSLPSSIMGELMSNGKVFLVNPNGVLIGRDALINTAGFIASTLDLSNEAFLADSGLSFKGDSNNSVVNLGIINAWDGDAILIGYQVDNQGKMNSPKGLSSLASGKEVFIKPSGEERVLIKLSAADGKEGTGIDHSGTISALQAEFKSDGNLYTLAINYKGHTEATAIEERKGRILLVADKGRTEFTGNAIAKGGEVRLLGQEIIVDGNASIDVSGDREGGTILIGGDYKGQNTPGPNALLTYVGKEVKLNASALVDGEGGKTILWSDRATHFLGNIEAKGGVNGGNGGFVEVSGKQHLMFDGLANTLAPKGKTGKLLLDPVNLTISSGGIQTNITLTTDPTGGCMGTTQLNSYGGSDCATVSNLPDTVINTALISNDVEISTCTGGNLTCTGGAALCVGGAGTCDITVNGNIVWATNHVLTINSDGDFIMNTGSSIEQSTGIAACSPIININAAAGAITLNGTISATSGTISLCCNNDITLDASSNGVGQPVYIATPIDQTDSMFNDDAFILITSNAGGLKLKGGANAGTFAQIGTNSALIDPAFLTTICEIEITLATGITLTAGNGAGSHVQIGHSPPTVVGNPSLNGGIAIEMAGDLTLTAAGGADSYAQIGHRPSATASTFIGSGLLTPISIVPAGSGFIDNVTLTGGGGNGAYALIGYGGGPASGPVTYGGFPSMAAGNLGVNIPAGNVTQNATVSLTGGSNIDTFAAIGFVCDQNTTFTAADNGVAMPNLGMFEVNTLTLTNGSAGANSGAYIGAFFYLNTAAVKSITRGGGAGTDINISLPMRNISLSTSGAGASVAAIGIDGLPGVTMGDFAGNVLMSAVLVPLINFCTPENTVSFALDAVNANAFIQDGIGNPAVGDRLINLESYFNLSLTGSGGGISAFVNGTGTANVLALNNLTLSNSFINGYATLYIQGNNDISLTNNSSIVGTGPASAVTLAVDFTANDTTLCEQNIFDAALPLFLDIGPGAFIVDATSFVQINDLSATNPLLIYTARHTQNMINGQINGAPFVLGTPFVNNNQNEYGVFLSNLFPPNTPINGVNANGSFIPVAPFYRVFYKEQLPMPPGPPGSPGAIARSLFQGLPDLYLYDELVFTKDLDFSIYYDESSFEELNFSKEFLSSYNILGDEEFFLRRKKHLLNQNPL